MNPETTKALTVDDLPGSEATLEEIIRFSRNADPTMDFIHQWGDDYKENVMALWQRCNQAFREAPPSTN